LGKITKHTIYYILAVIFCNIYGNAVLAQSLTSIGDDSFRFSLKNGFSKSALLTDTLKDQRNYELLNKGYELINDKKYDEAISVFNSYLNDNPNDIKIYMQLGYLYSEIKDFKNAYNSFKFVAENSIEVEEVDKAKTSMKYLRSMIIKDTITVSNETKPLKDTTQADKNTELLNKGYNFINQKKYSDAIKSFNTYLIDNPNDTKIQMQLAYLYDKTGDYQNAYNKFNFVADNSNKSEEIDKARTSMWYMKDAIIKKAGTNFELYYYNFYDSYYQNYVGNLLTHLNFKLANGVYTGPYLETYLDSKSNKTNIINDRFFDIGAFLKFNIFDWMALEIRTGYVREIDFQKNSLSFKPILSMGTRFGNAPFYLDKNSVKTENFYFDIYSSGLYDYKFRNVFGTLLTKEVLRYMLGGYSFMEFYLKQEVAMDSKKIEYNNYADIGGGVSFKPNIAYFPTLFIEALSRNYIVGKNPDGSDAGYFNGTLKNIFQVRVGFLINYSVKL